jgi:hypothetical protein
MASNWAASSHSSHTEIAGVNVNSCGPALSNTMSCAVPMLSTDRYTWPACSPSSTRVSDSMAAPGMVRT